MGEQRSSQPRNRYPGRVRVHRGASAAVANRGDIFGALELGRVWSFHTGWENLLSTPNAKCLKIIVSTTKVTAHPLCPT